MIPLGRDRAVRHFPFVTWLLLAANVAAFVHQCRLGDSLEPFLRRWALIPVRLWSPAPGQPPCDLLWAWVSPFTAMFLHGGLLHLLGNMLMLKVFGDGIEDRLGHLRFMALYLIWGLLASLAHVLLHVRSEVPMLGASGAIAGVMGAYLVLFPFTRVRFVVPVLFFPLVIRLPAVLYLLVWIATQVLAGYQSWAGGVPDRAGIAFEAHVGGFFAGLCSALWWRLRHRA
ncbi:MAG: rhomboid family intramembrane serine protease [Lentisphaeria bacterium]|nr:rhomboid family intramembrane serine protease [Lentisphaeria bacterium]